MKQLAFILVFALGMVFFVSSSAEAATRVNGYYKRSTGTYVQPHYRSNRNSTYQDNWSTRGNYNPYTGSRGYKTYNSYRSYRW